MLVELRGNHAFSPESGFSGNALNGAAQRTNGEGSWDGTMWCFHGNAGTTIWVKTDVWGDSRAAIW
ncbi:hypothetical protein NKG05_05930 [Oerskovia sp. M15]